MSDVNPQTAQTSQSGGSNSSTHTSRDKTPSISVANVSVGYENKIVVSDVSFDIASNQFVSILGPNGCGKTTLLSAMLGLVELTSGTVTIGDITISPDASSRSSRVRRSLASKVALVSQSHQSSFPFKVIDLVLTGRLPFIGATSTPSDQDYDIANEALETLGVKHFAQRSFPTLSGGERQMVLIARALAQQSDILFLDEPTTYLDIANQEKVLSTVQSLVTDLGKTVIAIIHEPNHALAFADQVILLGRDMAPETSLLGFGSAQETLMSDLVEAAYGIKVHIADTEHGLVAIPHRPCNQIPDNTDRPGNPSSSTSGSGLAGHTELRH